MAQPLEQAYALLKSASDLQVDCRWAEAASQGLKALQVLLHSAAAGTTVQGQDQAFAAALAAAGELLYLLAIQASQAGCHDVADAVLSALGFSHKLSSAVWQAAPSSLQDAAASAATAGCQGGAEPVVVQGLLPPALLRCLVAGLADPAASFWAEHSAGLPTTPFFSYLLHPLAASTQPGGTPPARHAVEAAAHLIHQRLLKHTTGALQALMQRVVAVEWWAHLRAPGPQMHQIHADVNEQLLRRGRAAYRLTHPLLSSVLFLSGTGRGGSPTLVLDQAPGGPLAQRVWAAWPRCGDLLLYPGDLLHGVLPPPPTGDGGGWRCTLVLAWWDADILPPADAGSSEDAPAGQRPAAASSEQRSADDHDEEPAGPRPCMRQPYGGVELGGGRSGGHQAPAATPPSVALGPPRWVQQLALPTDDDSACSSDGSVRLLAPQVIAPAWEAVARSGRVDEPWQQLAPSLPPLHFFISTPHHFRRVYLAD